MLPASEPPPDSAPSEEIFDALGDLVLTLAYEPAPRLLIARWFGIATPDSVMRGAQGLLAFARRHPEGRVTISDGSRIVGDWLELLPWTRYEFLPAFIECGIRAMAFLPSDDVSTQHGIISFSKAAGALLPVQVFSTEAAARAWLAQFATS